MSRGMRGHARANAAERASDANYARIVETHREDQLKWASVRKRTRFNRVDDPDETHLKHYDPIVFDKGVDALKARRMRAPGWS